MVLLKLLPRLPGTSEKWDYIQKYNCFELKTFRQGMGCLLWIFHRKSMCIIIALHPNHVITDLSYFNEIKSHAQMV